MQKITFQAMHCQMMAAIDCDTQLGSQLLWEVPDWFESWEQSFSRFRPDSELSQINRRSGETIQVSTVMQEMLEVAIVAQQESDSLVTPLILPALEAAGYDRSFDLIQMSDSEIAMPEAYPASILTDEHDDYLIPKSGVITLPFGVRLDFGGIVKGWAADQAVNRLGEIAPALVDAGGDIAASGPMSDGSPWLVGVANPIGPESQLDLVALYNGGVATSGRDYRRWRRGTIWQHHIIDPRSGQPAYTDVLTATVIAPSARIAETAAKTALIKGSVTGLSWLENHPHLAGIIVLEGGDTLESHLWQNHVWRISNEEYTSAG